MKISMEKLQVGICGKESGAEMHFAIVSGIITGDALFSYWPIFLACPK